MLFLIFWLLNSFCKKLCWVGICLQLLFEYFHFDLYKLMLVYRMVYFIKLFWSYSTVNIIKKYMKNKQNSVYLRTYVAWCLVFPPIIPDWCVILKYLFCKLTMIFIPILIVFNFFNSSKCYHVPPLFSSKNNSRKLKMSCYFLIKNKKKIPDLVYYSITKIVSHVTKRQKILNDATVSGIRCATLHDIGWDIVPGVVRRFINVTITQ